MGPPTFNVSALRILDMSLGQMLWSRRSVFLGLLVGGPVVLALAIRVATELHIGPPRAPRPGGPVLFGLPSGHTSGATLTLPFGVRARAIAGAHPRLVIEEAAVS